jgi:hypothetical protein
MGEGTEPEYAIARTKEVRQAHRRLTGDTALAVLGGLLAAAFVVGIGWRLLDAIR